jgi:hypothetical protein
VVVAVSLFLTVTCLDGSDLWKTHSRITDPGSMGPPAFPDFDAAVKAALDAAKAKRAQSVDARFMKPSGSSAPKLLTDETINVYLACRVVSAKKNNPSKPDIAYGSWAEVYKKSVYLTGEFACLS